MCHNGTLSATAAHPAYFCRGVTETSQVAYTVVVTDVVYGDLDVNVALNRPTFASSVLTSLYGSSHPASKAVDGNKDTHLQLGNSCFHSKAEANPWMAVDLGAAVAVVGVLFTNRGDCCGNAYLGYFVFVIMKLGLSYINAR